MDITLPPLESIIELTGIAIAVVSLIITIGVVWAEVVEAFVSNSDNFIRRGRPTRRLDARCHHRMGHFLGREARMGREAAEDGGEAGYASAPRVMDDR
ncbi:hypothetical protein CGCVW01_v007535 [Colletotrichum viniferum]|nr:hypothetical protein CGCVW01_v007535 [Colletotrichum viniferum]